jgi:hypothetical protein
LRHKTCEATTLEPDKLAELLFVRLEAEEALAINDERVGYHFEYRKDMWWT